MIGLTAFNIYTPWTIYPLSADETLWEAIQPGYLNARDQFGDTDILLGSGYFPLKPEQIERFSLGILFGLDKEDLFRNKGYAARTYNENYNFAKAPYVPAVTAVAGDNRVTLYWDDVAEKSIDPISGKDFEGYRVYRSTDPGFNDMTPITDMFGSVSYRKPLAQFDLVNGLKGAAAVAVNGVHFDLGTDSGLRHMWTDTTAVNGYKYYYAVTSYDRGDAALGIAPTECSRYISITRDGQVDKGKNVAILRPEAPAEGYTAPDTTGARWIEGSRTTANIRVKVIDTEIIGNRTYRITFGDTLMRLTSGVFPTTKSYTLADVTGGVPDTLFTGPLAPGDSVESPVTHGLLLTLENETGVALDDSASAWNREGLYRFEFEPFKYNKVVGLAKASDYRIEFGDLGIAVSTAFDYTPGKTLAAVPVNFRVLNASDGMEIPFAFWPRDGEDGMFTANTEKKNRSDWIVFLEESDGKIVPTWSFAMRPTAADTNLINPGPGDAVGLRVRKPFLSNDRFEFSTRPHSVDPDRAKAGLSRIRAVPNPYVVSNTWEPLNPYTSGRGPRELHFIHLPPRCTIKIFSLSGQLVDTIKHEAPTVADGTEIWDMLSRDQLDISYGVYIFHVDAGELGQKVGKFAVIK
jgi:hypothetical protein